MCHLVEPPQPARYRAGQQSWRAGVCATSATHSVAFRPERTTGDDSGDLGLNPAGFDAMTGVARVACGDYGSINECEGLRAPELPTGYKAGV